MNELQMIEAILDTPEPSDAVVNAGRARLQSAPRRVRRRFAWFATGSLGLAAAATAAVVVVTSGSPAPGRTPHGPPSGPASAPASARTVLLSAAEQVERQPATTGRFWHVKSRQVNLSRVGTPADPYTVSTEESQSGWLAREPIKGTSLRWTQYLGTRPATPADEAAWKKAGSPSMVKMINIGVKGKMLPIGPAGKLTGGTYDPTGPGDKIYAIGSRNVSMKELLALPADPARLRKYLLSVRQTDGESADLPKSSDAWLFAVAGNLVTAEPVKPAVRAAAYRLMSKLESVKVIGDVKDADGRQGTAVAINEGTVQRRLIMELGTGRVLADEVVVVKGVGTTAGFAPGTKIAYTVYQRNGWTNDKPRP